MKILDEPLSNFDIERIVNNLGMTNFSAGAFLKMNCQKMSLQNITLLILMIHTQTKAEHIGHY